jgi:hypothetical protein
MTRNGRPCALAIPVARTGERACSSSPSAPDAPDACWLLPVPTAIDYNGGHEQQTGGRRPSGAKRQAGLPAVLGMFWGAPLVARELESGTFRLAWPQGRSRLRWLGAKLAVVGLATLIVQGLLSLTTTWWWSPVGRTNPDRFSPALFGAFGIVPLGYAAFALALSVAAGVVIRRTLPAMAATLAVFAGVRLAVTYWIRPYFAAPLHLVLAVSPNDTIGLDLPPGGPVSLNFFPPQMPDAWIRSAQVTNAAGQKPSGALLNQLCPQFVQAVHGQGGMSAALEACVTKLSVTFHQTVVYQPASHYWPFQWAELGVFVALVLALAAFSAWWIRRRLT